MLNLRFNDYLDKNKKNTPTRHWQIGVTFINK